MVERRISYAQNAEDIVLARAFGDRSDGFYVDVGASEPISDSVTYYFYERGWHGLNIEPQPDCFQRLVLARPNDLNLNVGVGAEPGRLAFFYVPDAPGTSTFSGERVTELRDKGYQVERQEFPVSTLDDVFAEYVGDRLVDFLKVDVEGLEQAVLGAFDWTRWRPRVVVVESEVDASPWEERLVSHGYRRTLWDGINVFLVRDTDDAALGEALSRPGTVRDLYDPWLYVEQLRRAGESVETRLREAARAHADQLARSSAAYERQYARSSAAYEMLLRKTRDAYEDRLTTLGNERGALLEAAVAGAIGGDTGDESVRAALHALGSVLAERPDVLARFIASGALDTAGLLHWAASVTSQEAHVGPLIEHLGVYLRLSRSMARPTGAGAVAKRLGTSAAELLKARVRREPTIGHP